MDGDHDASMMPEGALDVHAPTVKGKGASSMDDFTNHLKELYGSNYFVAEMNKKFRREGRNKKASQTSLWLPLTFPGIPKKGNFDVRKLKESKYFFS